MTRFDAADSAERRRLFADAIDAHRERASPFLTIEVDDAHLADGPDPGSTDDAPRDDTGDASLGDASTDGADFDGSTTDAGPAVDPDDAVLDSDLGVPWIQFADGTCNLDCTDEELERLKATLEGYPAFSIDELTRPDDAAGTNVRVVARADPNRIAQFIDAVFERVYGLPASYRAWVVEI